MDRSPFRPIHTKKEQESTESYEKFLLAEYSNLSNAHYNTDKTITTFFQYYLLIVSLPLTLLASALRFLPTNLSTAGVPTATATSTATQPVAAAPLPADYTLLVVAGSFLIAIVGFFVMNYVVNLRLDALLYARAVNGIRRYFSEKSDRELGDDLRNRLLPTSAHRPRYVEHQFFSWVILAFALLDTGYGCVGFHFWNASAGPTQTKVGWALLALFFLLHYCSYLLLARYREYSYLRSNIIGLDVDGVINRHREHFCAMLKKHRNIDVHPDSITAIPVHKVHELGVKEEDEQAVFNHTEYWETMPPLAGAADVIRRLRNIFGYRVFIFTHRGWPDPRTYPTGQKQHYAALWRRAGACFCRPASWAIKNITRRWLKSNGFDDYSKLVVEQGNVYTTHRSILHQNRFMYAARNKIRLFVEDDLFKAKKLADICEVVFLIDQPYNQADEGTLARNIVRVNTWHDIYEFIREML